ncbi:MAG: hypothetical protein SVR08_11910 [Spirochaetota bacterium]|nr:hypothetical protein [Spirochaetota bacterium]
MKNTKKKLTDGMTTSDIILSPQEEADNYDEFSHGLSVEELNIANEYLDNGSVRKIRRKTKIPLNDIITVLCKTHVRDYIYNKLGEIESNIVSMKTITMLETWKLKLMATQNLIEKLEEREEIKLTNADSIKIFEQAWSVGREVEELAEGEERIEVRLKRIRKAAEQQQEDG